jgi:hypothetical protein
MSAIRLPSDNKIADGDGRLLPQYRAFFDRLAPLTALNDKQINTLNKIAIAMTAPDENGDTLLGDDGKIHLPVQDLNAVLEVYNAGIFVDSVSVENDGALGLNAQRGLSFSAKGEAGIVLSGISDSIRAPVAGAFFPATGQCSDFSNFELMTSSRIYAAHFSIPTKTVVQNVGPICPGSPAATSQLGIFSDAGMRPGQRLTSKSYTGFIANTPLETAANLNLDAGNYWVLFQLSAVINLKTANNAAFGGRLGYILASGDIRPITGIYRDPASGGFLDDESQSVWDAAYFGGPVFPFIAM